MSETKQPTPSYFDLGYDNDRDMRLRALQGKPWTFINMLPFPVNVYSKRQPPQHTEMIGRIEANSRFIAYRTKNGRDLAPEDEIHVTYLDKVKYAEPGTKGPEYEILRPEFLRADSREVRLGDVRYASNVRSQVITSHADIFGFRVHNHVGIPMDVYYKGRKIASMGPDDGTGYMAGTTGTVYLTNDNFGFNLGDHLGFSFPFGGGDNKKFVSVILPDNHISDIYVGDITQVFSLAIQDQWAYRVETPNINGLRYFNTNPGAAYGF